MEERRVSRLPPPFPMIVYPVQYVDELRQAHDGNSGVPSPIPVAWLLRFQKDVVHCAVHGAINSEFS